MNLNEELKRQKSLMQINEFAEDKTIPLQKVVDSRMFGPVYQGTHKDNQATIQQQGFQIFDDPATKAHGYPYQEYHGGYPPPLDHLGFGVYFTTSKAIAIHFNDNTAKGLKEYYLDVPRLETINFGSAKNMMNWWLKNGYDGELAKQGEAGRIMATKKLTDALKSNWDAVWFKGKGIHRLLDGDQIAVFDTSRIYMIDNKLAEPMSAGSKVISTKDRHQNSRDPNTPITVPKGTVGVIVNKKDIEDEIKQYPNHWARNLGTKYVYSVKWQRGGTESNIIDTDIQPK
jgi:hypothetical protein